MDAGQEDHLLKRERDEGGHVVVGFRVGVGTVAERQLPRVARKSQRPRVALRRPLTCTRQIRPSPTSTTMS